MQHGVALSGPAIPRMSLLNCLTSEGLPSSWYATSYVMLGLLNEEISRRGLSNFSDVTMSSCTCKVQGILLSNSKPIISAQAM